MDSTQDRPDVLAGSERVALIKAITPGPVAAVDTRSEFVDAPLYAGEQAHTSRAVASRQREFATARACARSAMALLGVPPREIATGPRGEPIWPDGIVGSITHCQGYRGAVLARAEQISTIGIDTEPDGPLPDGVLALVGLPAEVDWVRRLCAEDPTVSWDRLLFCAKEAVYKAWYPLAGRWLGFEDALITVDQVAGTFTARLLVAGPIVAGRPLTGFSGRWMAREGLVMTAIVRPAAADD